MPSGKAYCGSLQPNPDIAGLGAFLAVSIQVGMVIIAGLAFSISRYGESKQAYLSTNNSRSSLAGRSAVASKPRGVNQIRNQLSALSRLLFVVFDTQPIISVAIYVAFIINAPGLLDATGSLSNYHLRVSVHLQALSGIQLVAPLVLIFGSTRRRTLRFIWFEIHLVFFIGLSGVSIFLQKDESASILPLEREAQCFESNWASRKTALSTGIATLTGYLFLVCVAVAHVLWTNRKKYQKPPRSDDEIVSAILRAEARMITEIAIIAYLIAFAVSQIFIIQSLRKEYRNLWGDEENKWGFGQVLALVTMVPAIIDYIEAIILGIDRSLSAAVMQHGSQDTDKLAQLYFREFFSRILQPWKWWSGSQDPDSQDSDSED